MGQGDAATALLERLLSEAKRRGDDFEQALTLDALIVARSAVGDATGDLLRERSQLTKKLGIVRIPSFPTASLSAPMEPGVVA
jgi:hypothetical protein